MKTGCLLATFAGWLRVPCRLGLGSGPGQSTVEKKKMSVHVRQRPLGVIVSHAPPNPPALPYEGERPTAVVLCLLFYTYNDDYDIHNNTLPFHQHSLKPGHGQTTRGDHESQPVQNI